MGEAALLAHLHCPPSLTALPPLPSVCRVLDTMAEPHSCVSPFLHLCYVWLLPHPAATPANTTHTHTYTYTHTQMCTQNAHAHSQRHHPLHLHPSPQKTHSTCTCVYVHCSHFHPNMMHVTVCTREAGEGNACCFASVCCVCITVHVHMCVCASRTSWYSIHHAPPIHAQAAVLLTTRQCQVAAQHRASPPADHHG